MLKVNVASLVAFVAALAEAQGTVKGTELKWRGGSPRTPLDENFRTSLKAMMTRLAGDVQSLGVPVTEAAIRRFIEKCGEPGLSYQNLADSNQDILLRLQDELKSVSVYYIEREKTKYYEPAEPLFGEEVDARFPSAIDDIIDAGRCIALASGTASVFHSMRVMEVGLKALGHSLKIPYAPSWGSYIKQINSKIAVKPRTKGIRWKKDEPFYRDVVGDLTAVKLAWRNPTMHIVKRYSPDEAEEIFRAVRTFMNRLASRFDENGKRIN